MRDIMKTEPHRILKIIRQTQAEYTFRVEYQGSSLPGQFFMLSIPRIGEAPISVSGKEEGFVEFTIRRVGRFTDAVFALSEQETIFMRGPYGNSWPVELLENKDLIVVSSGTGFASIRTTLMHFAEKPEIRKEVYLIAGFKDRNSTLFDEDRAGFCRCFHTIYPLSREKELLPSYKCGRVTAFLDQVPIEDMHDYNIIIAGAPPVISATCDHYLKRGAAPERIWVSFERRMQCGVGKCGYCRINETYVCLDGPIFNYSDASNMFD